jgi:hypothetical protein
MDRCNKLVDVRVFVDSCCRNRASRPLLGYFRLRRFASFVRTEAHALIELRNFVHLLRRRNTYLILHDVILGVRSPIRDRNSTLVQEFKPSSRIITPFCFQCQHANIPRSFLSQPSGSMSSSGVGGSGGPPEPPWHSGPGRSRSRGGRHRKGRGGSAASLEVPQPKKKSRAPPSEEAVARPLPAPKRPLHTASTTAEAGWRRCRRRRWAADIPVLGGLVLLAGDHGGPVLRAGAVSNSTGGAGSSGAGSSGTGPRRRRRHTSCRRRSSSGCDSADGFRHPPAPGRGGSTRTLGSSGGAHRRSDSRAGGGGPSGS